MAAQPPAQAAGAGAVAAAPNVVFRLFPGGDPTVLMDYDTPTGAKFFHRAIAPIEPAFDLQPENLKLFLSCLSLRCGVTGWEFTVPVDVENPGAGEYYDLLTEYGQVSLEHVRDYVETYNAEESRLSQDSHTIFLCIMASLTKEAKRKIVLFSDQYTVNGQSAGLPLLKLVVREASTDTNSTVRVIRERLTDLPAYMGTIKSDIEKFNIHVKTQLDALYARGENTTDLVANLFKGYKAASDKEFRAYIRKKEEDYDESTQEMDYQRLMLLASNKYKTLVESGRWNTPSEEDNKIIALEAQVKQLVKLKKKAKDSDKDKNKNKNKNKRQKPEWMTQEPKSGEKQTKERDGKTYHWCPKHKAWGIHKPEDCEGRGFHKKGKTSKKKDDEKGNDNKKTLKLTKALAAIAEESSDEEE